MKYIPATNTIGDTDKFSLFVLSFSISSYSSIFSEDSKNSGRAY